jgi:signal transduction histidine kinase
LDRPRWSFWLPATVAIIVLSFVAATGFGQWRLRTLDHAVVEIADVTAPSIEHLATARGEIRTLQALVREGVATSDAIAYSRRTLDESINAYLVLPVSPGEQDLWRDLFRAKSGFDHALSRGADVSAHAAELSGAITRAIAFNGKRSHDLAVEIQRARHAAFYAAIGMDIVCTVIAFAAVALLRRMARAHQALDEQHRRLQEERASELEQFAGRVAHDILSPLGTVGFSLELAGKAEDRNERARFIERGTASLYRCKRLVDGLLRFARAGAKPEPGARADVAEVMTDMASELQPAATAAGTKLVMQAGTVPAVACDPGVLTSLVANLARNALKYIGDGPVKRVEARALDRGESVRVEVEDTGPGLPPDVEHRVFDAYARSRSAIQPGIGLGLATVKRLAESHGGSVGVRSVPGKGCTFWFELPKAAPAAS